MIHDDVIAWKHFNSIGPLCWDQKVTGEFPAQKTSNVIFLVKLAR